MEKNDNKCGNGSAVGLPLEKAIKTSAIGIFNTRAGRLGAMATLTIALAVPALADSGGCWGTPVGAGYCFNQGFTEFEGSGVLCGVRWGFYCPPGESLSGTPEYSGCSITGVDCS